MFDDLTERSRQILREIVDTYVETGEPVGSRRVSRRLDERLSPATVRNVMADLEDLGLLTAPHTSAGRLPSHLGLRLYVDGLLEVGEIPEEQRRSIEKQCSGAGRSIENVLVDVSETLSGLSNYAGMVVAPNSDRPFKHVEFVPLGPGRALVVMVNDNGLVENRVIDVPGDLPTSALIEAGNYITSMVAGRTLNEAAELIRSEIAEHQVELDALTQKVVQSGVATWTGSNEDDDGLLIVRGQANLLDDVTTKVDIERIRSLFQLLEKRRSMAKLVEAAEQGNGVQIFIGAENDLFALSGCSAVLAPYRAGDAQGKSSIVGAIGVIGSSRMNYSRIVPLVDYTAQLVTRMLSRDTNRG